MVAERPRKKQKKNLFFLDIWTSRQGNHESMGWCCCYRSSILLNYNNYPCTGFLIDLNCSRFFLKICVYIWFFECQLFLVSGYVGVGNSSFLMKGIFYFLTGTILVPVEIELVPRFGLLASPRQYCNTLQHTATHCNALQHTATHCNTLQHTAARCNTFATIPSSIFVYWQYRVNIVSQGERERGERGAHSLYCPLSIYRDSIYRD